MAEDGPLADRVIEALRSEPRLEILPGAVDPASRQPVVEEGRSGGKYRVRIDKTMYGLINGGGPEILFQTFNGNIYIRKAK